MRLYILRISRQWAHYVIGVTAENFEAVQETVQVECSLLVDEANTRYSVGVESTVREIVFYEEIENEGYEG